MARPDTRELVTSAVANAEHDTDGFKYVKDEVAAIAIAAVEAAIESLEVQQDLTTDAVDLTTAAQASNEAAVAAVQAAIEALPIDPISGALIGIDISHKRIHGGVHFTFFHSDATATNTGERTLIAFKTPDTTARIHFLYQASASAAAHFHIIRGPAEGAAGGTEVTPLNSDENSATVSVLKSARVGTANRLATYVAADAGNIAGGTTIRTELIGATGQGQMTTGGATRDKGELILKQNTVYAVAVENLDNSDNTHGIFIDWYEVI